MEYSNMLITIWFLKSLIELYRKHVIYSDGDLWYRKAYKKYVYFVHNLKKALLKDNTEGFDDYY